MRTLFAIAVLLVAPSIMSAQSFPKEQYKSEKVTWLGLDFTNAKLIDHFAFTNPAHLASSYVPEWNNFVITEPSKFNVKRYFHKHDMEINIDHSSNFNEEIDPDNLVQNNSYTFEDDFLAKDVKKYAEFGFEGVGIVMYVESFNKNRMAGTYWLVFVDMSSGNILFKEKEIGEPSGFGVRNFWISTFHRILKTIDVKMNKWLK